MARSSSSRRGRWYAVGAFVAVAIVTGGVSTAIPGGSSTDTRSIVPLAPVRLLDTRAGIGGASAPIGSDSAFALAVAGVGGVPADATGVLLNVTAVNGTASSFMTVYPDGTSRPDTSNLNWGDNEPHPNLVSVSLGANG